MTDVQDGHGRVPQQEHENHTRVAPPETAPTDRATADGGQGEQSSPAPEERLRFIDELMSFVYEEALEERFWWSSGRLRANCNDFFWWGTADSEDITPENFEILKQAVTDVGEGDSSWAVLLFCARVRQMRPQGCCYPEDERFIALFDACGPKRDIDFLNPYAHPNDGGKYEYDSAKEPR